MPSEGTDTLSLLQLAALTLPYGPPARQRYTKSPQDRLKCRSRRKTANQSRRRNRAA